MGLFKQLKDMKGMVQAAPGMIAQAQEMGAQAQQLAAAQQAAAQAQMAQGQMAQGQMAQGQMAQAGMGPGALASGPDFEPISGVSLELFASISKGVAAFNYDQSKLVDVAASKGVSELSWGAAAVGWNARIRSNPAVGQQFNQLYRAV